MSNLNVNEIEANGTNSNVKVVSKSTDGSCKIKSGSNDATLQLNCSAQSHGVKLKAPADSAGQNYTIALPDNQIAANKFLKVKSVVGSGSTGVGQLEFSDVPTGIYPNLNADNITTGTLPVARVGSFSASSGAGFKLISSADFATGSVTSVDFTGLEDNAVYLIKAKELSYSTADQKTAVAFLDASGNQYSNHNFTEKRGYSGSQADYGSNSTYGYFRPGLGSSKKYQFQAYLMVSASFVFMWLRGQSIDSTVSGFHGGDGYLLNMNFNTGSTAEAQRVHGIRFYDTNRNIAGPTTIRLYKFMES